ncbi:MAG TPA: alpha-amylase family glycosyl hydrolase [Desulfomonilaceae bacterium]|nr:alpha-amylase family glycosyl hydrolase [Desulfomonilaceae bacterium]
MTHWAWDAIFYHIYPLGFCGAPSKNDFCSPVVPRLELERDWIPHLRNLGVNALYLGPVFESGTHGYDTADYFQVDRRLGNNGTLSQLVSSLHENGIRVILDGVFHHVGRDFWAFRHILDHHQNSPYCAWFQGLSFGRHSPYDDPFSYEAWNGHYNLVKLNLQNPDVKNHLFQAVEMWIQEFDINGLRLDAADYIDLNFLKELAGICRHARPDFWLVGEVIHGDYRKWANPETLDSVTNYECYKGLYSSHVDKNYFEIAYSLNRQFGERGIYRHLPLYSFADNHDVDRVASSLKRPEHLYPLYCLLFAMPGVPSIYYGSEWGIEGKKKNGDDSPLRPHLDLSTASQTGRHHDLAKIIGKLSKIRRGSEALKYGHYRQLAVRHEQLAFARQTSNECVIVLVNAADHAIPFELSVPANYGNQLIDMLNPGESFPISRGKAEIDVVWPRWARIMLVT